MGILFMMLLKKRPGITLTGCMAHARRYFEKALGNDKARAEYFITQAQQLYAVEKLIRDEQLTGENILALRKEKSLPVLNAMEAWLRKHITDTTPTSPIGKAIAYSLSRWEKLTAYVYDPILEIDNNLVENAIRPTVIGRNTNVNKTIVKKITLHAVRSRLNFHGKSLLFTLKVMTLPRSKNL
jgi:hypothetical protein